MFIDTLDNILTALKSNIKQGLVDEEIFISVFDGKHPDNFDQLMNKLTIDGLVYMGEKGYKHYWGQSFVLTLKGITFIDNGGYTTLELKTKRTLETQAEKENLELQKLRSENEKLVNDLIEFPKIKSQRKWLFIIAIIELLAIIIGLILQSKGK
jgi:hypothetical protein